MITKTGVKAFPPLIPLLIALLVALPLFLIVMYSLVFGTLFTSDIRAPLNRTDLFALINIIVVAGGFGLALRQFQALQKQNITSQEIEKAENLIARDKEYESVEHSKIRQRFHVLCNACEKLTLGEHGFVAEDWDDLSKDHKVEAQFYMSQYFSAVALAGRAIASATSSYSRDFWYVDSLNAVEDDSSLTDAEKRQLQVSWMALKVLAFWETLGQLAADRRISLDDALGVYRPAALKQIRSLIPYIAQVQSSSPNAWTWAMWFYEEAGKSNGSTENATADLYVDPKDLLKKGDTIKICNDSEGSTKKVEGEAPWDKPTLANAEEYSPPKKPALNNDSEETDEA